MKPHAFLTVIATLAMAAQPAPKYADADGPEVQAAAREARARAKVLDMRTKVLDVVGLTLGIDGLLKELGAKVTAQEIRIALQAEVLFDFDRAELKPEARIALGKVAEVIRANPGRPVVVEGHTDGKGDAAYNQKLSERRAASVKDWLVATGGAEASRLTTRGFGKTRPVASNARPDGSDDPEGRQRNRRVEIAIQKSP